MVEHVRPGWYPDPLGHGEYRYWDGEAWTQHVSTGAQHDVEQPAADEPVVPAWPQPVATERRRIPRTPLDVALDVAAVAGVVLLLLFPALAIASVPSRPQLRDAAVALPPLQRDHAGKPLQSMPAFQPDGNFAGRAAEAVADRTSMGQALNAASTAVFGNDDGGLSQLVQDSSTPVFDTSEVLAERIPYPFQFPAVDKILDPRLGTQVLADDQIGPVNDFAALLILANAKFRDVFPNAASVAYDLLDRARRTDQCLPQLNLAFLLSTDSNPRDDDTATEFDRAAKDCPDDPTPLWLLGQFQSGRASTSAFEGQQLDIAERQSRPVPTFQRLQQEFPGSPLGWSGEADTLLRFAYDVDVAQPFTARTDYRRAKALYQRARALDDSDAGLPVGEARADAGLSKFDDAIANERAAVDKAPDSALAQVRLVDYLERAHRFGDAADTNAQFLSGTSSLPDGSELIAATTVGPLGFREDAGLPVSTGSERFVAVTLIVGPPPGGAGGGASDFSFIPTFRTTFGVTGTDRWCRDWSLTRDLVAAGRAEEALRNFPTSFHDFRDPPPNNSCEADDGLLRAVATLEAGDLHTAVADFRSSPAAQSDLFQNDNDPARSVILDADQNLWRFAGDFGRAAATTKQWAGLEPNDSIPPERSGEIAFLQRNFDTAASQFTEAVQRAQANGSDVHLADAQLKLGTALELKGDFDGARQALQQADDTVTPLVPDDIQRAVDSGEANLLQLVLDSYNARAQLGDTELRAKNYDAAEQHYQAARVRERNLPVGDVDSPFESLLRGERLLRPEVLENNEALVLVELGRPQDALDVAKKAVSFDPSDPIFLENQGFAQEKLGDLDGAADSYRAVLAADPTVFPAANDLGVILAKQGKLAAAADAFGQALAANPEYATAQFNLGLVLDQEGPSHLLESQGQLAAATRTDSSLRQADRTLVFDDDTFFTTLDLSKPLPPTWHFSSSTKRTPIAVAGVVLVILLYRLVKALAVDQLSDKATERMLATSKSRRLQGFSRIGERVPAIVALVATVAVFVYPMTQSDGTTVTDTVVLGAGIAIATLAFMRLRTMVARRDQVRTRHYSWLPAIFVGGAAAFAGFGYAPLPATDDVEGSLPHRARWFGTALLGSVTLLLLIVGRVSEVPLASDLGAAALVMTSSSLTPVEPYDGAYLEESHWGLVIALALTGVGVLLFLGVL